MAKPNRNKIPILTRKEIQLKGYRDSLKRNKTLLEGQESDPLSTNVRAGHADKWAKIEEGPVPGKDSSNDLNSVDFIERYNGKN